jgi:CRP-like cAMP-binding protein
MPHLFLQQRERHRASTLQRLGITDDLFDRFNHAVAPFAKQMRFRKGDYLQRCGEPALAAYWLTGGVTRRGLIMRDGQDVSMGFATDGEPCGSHHDLLAGEHNEPAREFIIAESSVSAVRLEWAMLRRLREQHEFMREYYVKLSEYSLKHYSHSCHIRIMGSAEERLLAFRDLYPGLEARISQKSLASFLGITPQYMSTLLRRAHSRAESAGTDRPA